MNLQKTANLELSSQVLGLGPGHGLLVCGVERFDWNCFAQDQCYHGASRGDSVVLSSYLVASLPSIRKLEVNAELLGFATAPKGVSSKISAERISD